MEINNSIHNSTPDRLVTLNIASGLNWDLIALAELAIPAATLKQSTRPNMAILPIIAFLSGAALTARINCSIKAGGDEIQKYSSGQLISNAITKLTQLAETSVNPAITIRFVSADEKVSFRIDREITSLPKFSANQIYDSGYYTNQHTETSTQYENSCHTDQNTGIVTKPDRRRGNFDSEILAFLLSLVGSPGSIVQIGQRRYVSNGICFSNVLLREPSLLTGYATKPSTASICLT